MEHNNTHCFKSIRTVCASYARQIELEPEIFWGRGVDFTHMHVGAMVIRVAGCRMYWEANSNQYRTWHIAMGCRDRQEAYGHNRSQGGSVARRWQKAVQRTYCVENDVNVYVW